MVVGVGEGLRGLGGGVLAEQGDVAMALRAWACLDGMARPLPLCLCSCVTHCLPVCNFPPTVTVWAHSHPGNF